MAKLLTIFVVALIFGATGASAACPPAATGTVSEAIRANEARVLCLQRELSAEMSRRELELDMTTLQRSIQDMQLQQKFNALPAPIFFP